MPGDLSSDKRAGEHYPMSPGAAMYIEKLEPSNKRALLEFIEYARRLYADSPYWTAPLYRDVLHKLDVEKNPFYAYGRLSIHVARDERHRIVGRAVAIINPQHEALHGTAAGFFGLFECDNNVAVAKELMEVVEACLVAEGCDCVIGPVNLSTNDESGFLLEGFDRFPTFMCNYCHPYYHDLMDACGYSRLNDTFSYEAETLHPLPEKYRRVSRRVEKNRHINLRHFTKKTAAIDIGEIVSVYNASFRDTWGFVPISRGEADELARDVLPFVDEQLIWIATYDGDPVGAIMGFPDINEVLKGLDGRLHLLNLIRIVARKRRITGMRIAAFGVLPRYRNMGIETLMIRKVQDRVLERPYRRSEFSVVLEDNHRMRNLLISAGFSECRRFRIYGKEL
jgi:GNAT superfamily N-acetyltransferase